MLVNSAGKRQLLAECIQFDVVRPAGRLMHRLQQHSQLLQPFLRQSPDVCVKGPVRITIGLGLQAADAAVAIDPCASKGVTQTCGWMQVSPVTTTVKDCTSCWGTCMHSYL